MFEKKTPDEYTWTGISFPVSFADIQRFEDLNKVCINVYGVTEGNISPIRLGNIYYIPNDNINLLLLIENENGHYVYITKHRKQCCTLQQVESIRTVDIALAVEKQRLQMKYIRVV